MRIAGKRHTDQEIIAAIQEGGQACEWAMKYLYRTHLEKICSFVVGKNGSREEAKDVFQDSIVNLLIAIQSNKFERKSTLGTYLYGISKNLWYRRFNRSLKQENMDPSTMPEDMADTTPEVILLKDDRRDMLNELLGQLKTKCREVLLFWAQKYSMKEIAQRLGYGNEQVVRNKKNHCLKELKEKVRNNPDIRNVVKELVDD